MVAFGTMNQEDTHQILDTDWAAPNRARVPVLIPQAQSNPRATIDFDEVLLDDDIREILSEDGWQVGCLRIAPRAVILVNHPMYTPDGPVELGRFVIESLRGAEYCPPGTVALPKGKKRAETWVWNIPGHHRHTDSPCAINWLTTTEAQLEYRVSELEAATPGWKGNNGNQQALSLKKYNHGLKMDPCRKWPRGTDWANYSVYGKGRRGYNATQPEVVEFAIMLDKALMATTLPEIKASAAKNRRGGSKVSMKGLRRTLTNIRQHGTPEDYDEVCLILEQALAEFKKGWQPEEA